MKSLNEIPQKDGQSTEYVCGLIVTGGWSTRLEKHKEFINTKIGKYILEIESELKKLRVTDVSRRSEQLKCDVCNSNDLRSHSEGLICGDCNNVMTAF